MRAKWTAADPVCGLGSCMAEADLQQKLAAADDQAPAEAAETLKGIISGAQPSTAEVIKVKEQVHASPAASKAWRTMCSLSTTACVCSAVCASLAVLSTTVFAKITQVLLTHLCLLRLKSSSKTDNVYAFRAGHPEARRPLRKAEGC